MMHWIRRLLILLTFVAMGLAGLVVAARSGWLSPDESSLRKTYALAHSQFIDIDGQSVHFTDEGRGPAVVLIHGTFGSLRNWHDWVETLRQSYRIIRFDRPRMGLSGPAPAGRAETEQEIHVIDALTAKLNVDEFFLVATSSAGASGAKYAADNPDRVRGLILSNIAIGDYLGRSERSLALRLLLKADPWLGGWRSARFWREVLLINFHNDHRVSDAHAQEWSDLNNRAQQMPARNAPFGNRGSNAVDDLQRMTVPTLLLWSDHDHERPVEIVGQLGLENLASQDKSLQVVENCGHIMPLDCGPESVAPALAFFRRLSRMPSASEPSPGI